MWNGEKVTPEDGRVKVTRAEWAEMHRKQVQRVKDAEAEVKAAIEAGDNKREAEARRWLRVNRTSLQTMEEHMPKDGTDASNPTPRR